MNPLEWDATIWTAVFTGLTVVAMIIGIRQTHLLSNMTLAPMIPDVSVSFSTGETGDVMYVRIPASSQYRIKAVSLYPRNPNMRRIEDSGERDNFGTSTTVETGPWASQIKLIVPTQMLILKKLGGRSGHLKVTLVSDILPKRTAIITL